jgi:hypothetical protein
VYFLAWFVVLGQIVFVIWFFARRTPWTAAGIALGAACFVAAFVLALSIVLTERP